MARRTLTAGEAAAYLHLSPAAVRRRARNGNLPATKTGRIWAFRKWDLDEWLVDEQMALEMAERKREYDGIGIQLDQFLRERGL